MDVEMGTATLLGMDIIFRPLNDGGSECVVKLGSRELGGIAKIDDSFLERLEGVIASAIATQLFKVFQPLMTTGFGWVCDHGCTVMRWTPTEELFRFDGSGVDQSQESFELTLVMLGGVGRRWQLNLSCPHGVYSHAFDIEQIGLPPSRDFVRIMVHNLMCTAALSNAETVARADHHPAG